MSYTAPDSTAMPENGQADDDDPPNRQPYDLGPLIADPPALLRHVLAGRPPGTALEFGVGTGTSLRIIAQTMPVIGFDSFQGLPENWRDEFTKGAFACPYPLVHNAMLRIGM